MHLRLVANGTSVEGIGLNFDYGEMRAPLIVILSQVIIFKKCTAAPP